MWLSRLPRQQASQIYDFVTDASNVQNMGLWLSALTASFLSVLFALAFRKVEGFARIYLSPHNGYWSFLLSPLLFLLAWYVVRRFSPEAVGSGIPQIMAANETEYEGVGRERVDRLLSLRALWVKVLSALLCVAGGGAIGREGPTLQISASIFHFFGKQIRRFIPSTNEQTWIVAGSAAGLASAFNTPLGGIVYAIEELGAVHFHRVRTALLSAVIVSGLVAQWLLGSYLYLGYPQLQTINFGFLPWALVTGIVSGGMGGLFGHILYRLAIARARLKDWRKQAAITVGCGLSIALLVQVSIHATGPGVETVSNLLFRDEHADLSLVFIRFSATIISYLSGAAGGIFSPALAVGATVGSFMVNIVPVEHPQLMILLGMIGFLTGVTRTPFTSFILVLEMTDRHVAIFPMMMTALISLWAARQIDRTGFYEHMKERWMPEEEHVQAPAPVPLT